MINLIFPFKKSNLSYLFIYLINFIFLKYMDQWVLENIKSCNTTAIKTWNIRITLTQKYSTVLCSKSINSLIFVLAVLPIPEYSKWNHITPYRLCLASYTYRYTFTFSITIYHWVLHCRETPLFVYPFTSWGIFFLMCQVFSLFLGILCYVSHYCYIISVIKGILFCVSYRTCSDT